jgi:AmmeMemoRadiSam system protein A
MSLNGKELLQLARDSIQEKFTGKKRVIDPRIKEKYSDKKGAFVTLYKNDDLRGCIGTIEPKMPLWNTICEMAKSAAFNDTRFPALTREGLKDIKFEISVLTVPKIITAKKPEDYYSQIEIGKHGLIIEGKGCKGLLLPHVFPEFQISSPDEALDMTCKKAGLEHDAWMDLDAVKVYRFETEIVKES